MEDILITLPPISLFLSLKSQEPKGFLFFVIIELYKIMLLAFHSFGI